MIGEIGGSAEEEAAKFLAAEKKEGPLEANRWLHRGPHSPSRPPHGPRRRDRRRRQRRRRRQDRSHAKSAVSLWPNSPHASAKPCSKRSANNKDPSRRRILPRLSGLKPHNLGGHDRPVFQRPIPRLLLHAGPQCGISRAALCALCRRSECGR